MLAGTAEGLLTFSCGEGDYENVRFHCNTHRPQQAGSLSGKNVMHIFSSGGEGVFVATFDGGFQKILSGDLLTDSLRFEHFRAGRDRTIPRAVLATVEDTQGQLWVVSEEAVTRFDPAEKRFDPVNADRFVRGNYFTEAIPAVGPGGDILLGMDGGHLLFNPILLSRDNDTPPIVFTEITLQGKSVEKIYRCDSLTVTPQARNLSIRFAAIGYTDAAERQYAYRLEGLDSEWNYTGENRSVSYINLPKGHYRFLVRSTNGRGNWVDNTLALPIEVLLRFRETALAWVLYGLIVAGLIAFAAYSISHIYRLRYRVSMEQQLADIKLRFFTDISHELRTPLTLIASPVREVLEQEPLSPHATEYLTVVKQNVERMMQLVNQILDFRKIQHKKMKLLVEYTNLSAIICRIMEEFHLIAAQKRIDFRLEKEEQAVMCWVDRDKFEKIVFNLLSNAFKFTPAGQSIVIRIGSSGGRAVLSVIDTGIGIPRGQLARLFERFVSTTAYDNLQPSSGIGLSMVRELTLLHHGEVEVFSREGEGSEFRITLPCGREHFEKDKSAELIVSDADEKPEEQPEHLPERPQTTDKPDTDNRPLLLVVEDNPELAAFLSGVLGRDYRIREAADGQSGLEAAFTEQPDFILTDVMMPVMDGLEMVRAIKENPNTCHIPIVVLSARSSLDDRIHALEYGIDDYITKPFSSSYLKARIATLLDQRRRLQEQVLASLSENGLTDLSPSKPQVVAFDRQFMERLMAFMEANMDNTDLLIDDLAAALDMSRSIFYRKLKSIVGLSPVDFIRVIRLKRAMQLIDTGEFTFSRIAYMTGFGDPKYFGKYFKKQVGVTLSEYKAGKRGAGKTINSE